MNRPVSGKMKTVFRRLNWRQVAGPCALLLLALVISGFPQVACGQEPKSNQEQSQPANGSQDAASAEDASTRPATDAAPDSGEVVQTAWEYRPYQVLVWLVHDHTAGLEARESQLIEALSRRCQVAEPNAWQVTLGPAPNPWDGRLQSERSYERWTEDLIKAAWPDPAKPIDKLLIIRIGSNLGMLDVSVQELDLATKIWGSRIGHSCDVDSLELAVFDGIRRAFMPLTRIDRIHENNVLVRVRASGISLIPNENADGALEMVPNTGSPVWVADHEILLPVIFRKDRNGEISSITSVEATYLSILSRTGPHLECDTHSAKRAPLGGRSGARTERMALCVRSPHRPTTVRFVTEEEPHQPLRDLEVYSRLPGMEAEETSEFLGKSDWKGEIIVPPNERGIRLLYIKSGQRPLAQVPVVPGLRDTQDTPLPDDHIRLYAEGIVKAYRNELMDLVARREILAYGIESALDEKRIEDAESKLTELRRLEDAQRFVIRLETERRTIPTANGIQKTYIDQMFTEISTLAQDRLSATLVSSLSQQVRNVQAGRPRTPEATAIETDPAEDTDSGDASASPEPSGSGN
jgi:hypothetical protein